MPCRIYLRRDQKIADREVYSSSKVTVFAPAWVKKALNILGGNLNGLVFELYDNSVEQPVESFSLTENFNENSLITLQKIARNESSNVSGVINSTQYPDIKDRRIIYSIRDLVRQCVVAGIDACSSCGGYMCPSEKQEESRLYLCDLAALQFQQPYNSGRLILVQQNQEYEGIFDDFIYENVVGEKKITFQEIKSRLSLGETCEDFRKRYLPHDGFGLPGLKQCFVDTKAYASFVKLDVILCGLAIVDLVKTHNPNDKINFKFLKYGTGFFAGKFATLLNKLILSAVLDGLEELFKKSQVLEVIKCVELPFYKRDPTCASRIESLERNSGINVIFGVHDALKTNSDGLIVGTTNCGDNHAPCGNEMGFSSVDAAIAENLNSKGNIFCPNINLLISEQYLQI